MKQWLKIMALIGLVLFFYVLFRRKKARDEQHEKEMKERYVENLRPKYYKFDHYTSEGPSDDFSGGHIQDEYREFYREHFTSQSILAGNQTCPQTIPGINSQQTQGIPVSISSCVQNIKCDDLTDNSTYTGINIQSSDGTYPGFVISLSMGNVPPQHHGMVLDSRYNPSPNYDSTGPFTNIKKAMVYNGFDINLEQDPFVPHANQQIKGMIGQCDYSMSYYRNVNTGSVKLEETVYEKGTDASAFHYFTYNPNGTNNRNDSSVQTSNQHEDNLPAKSNTGIRTVPLVSRGFTDRYSYAGTCTFLNPDFKNISIPKDSTLVELNNSGPLYGPMITNNMSQISTLKNIGPGLLTLQNFNMNPKSATDSTPIGTQRIQYLLDHYYGCTDVGYWQYSGETNTVPCRPITDKLNETSVEGVQFLYDSKANDPDFNRYASQCLCSHFSGTTFYEYPYFYSSIAPTNAQNSYLSTINKHRTELGKGGFAVNTSTINNNQGRVNKICNISNFNLSSCTLQNPYDTQKLFNSKTTQVNPKTSNYINSLQSAVLTKLPAAYNTGGKDYYGGITSLLYKFPDIFPELASQDPFYIVIVQLVHWEFMDEWVNMTFGRFITPPSTITAHLLGLAEYYYNNYTILANHQSSYNNAKATLQAIGTSIQNTLSSALPNNPPAYQGDINKIDLMFNSAIGIGASLSKLMYSCYYAAGNQEKLKALAASYFPGHDHKRSWMYAMYPEQRKKSRIYFDGYTADLNHRWASGNLKVNDPYEDFEQYGNGQVTNAFTNGAYTEPNINTVPYSGGAFKTKDSVLSTTVNDYSGMRNVGSNANVSKDDVFNQMVLKRSIVVPHTIYQSSTSDYIQTTTFPRVYSVLKFMGPKITINNVETQQPLITFFWAHIPIYPGCGYPSYNMDMIDLYAQNDYSSNAFHDKIFMFYLVGDEYREVTSNGVTTKYGWKHNLNKKGIYPICEEDYYIESVYNGDALLARSNEDASQRLNVGNYHIYAENDISATIDTSDNLGTLGGNFGNFRFYVKDTGVFIYKDRALNGEFTPYTGLIPTPGLISCVGIKHWTPFRESDGSQSVFKSMIIQQGYNDYSLTASGEATTPSVPNSTPSPVTTNLNGTLDTHFNNIQYNWEHIDTIRIQRHPIHPEQVLRPITMNAIMFKAEGWKILNIGGGSQFIQPTKKDPFAIINNQVADKYFTSGICQLNKWGLPATNHIVKGEWIQSIINGTQIRSYSFSSLQGYGTDSKNNGPHLLGAGNGPILDRSIRDWLLLASTDEINWVVLDRQMNQNFNSTSFNKTFTINYPSNYVSSNPSSSQLLIPSYNYVRLVVSAVSSNNLDLIWDVGNFYVTNFSGVNNYGASNSTSIVDKLVTNCSDIASDKARWYESHIKTGYFANAVLDPKTTILPTYLHSVIQDITTPDYDNIIQNPSIMNNTIKSYRTNPATSDMINNYSATSSGGVQNRMVHNLGNNKFVSIHLNNYIYPWSETYSNSKLGNKDSNGILYKPDYVGMPIFSINNGMVKPSYATTDAPPFNLPSFYQYPIRKARPIDAYSDSRLYQNLLSSNIMDYTYLFNTDSSNNTFNQTNNTDWYDNKAVLLDSHWIDVSTQFPMAIRVNANRWDKPSTMFLNRSKYNYYRGTTSTTFTNPFSIPSLLQTEKPGDVNANDSRFNWSLPFYTGSYLISPYSQVQINYDANGNQINSNSSDTNSDRVIPNYCFWIEDAATYQKLVQAGVSVSSNDNFNMKIKLPNVTPADTNTYNDVPKRCLGALYTKSDGKSNISTYEAIDTLCPSPLQYKALGWKLCYLPSGCQLTYNAPGTTNRPNAIINKYNNIMFKIMDAYTAQLYYEADPNRDIVSDPSLSNVFVFTVPGGCSTCNCQSRTSQMKNTSSGYCIRASSSNYYDQMKEINRQENVPVFNMQSHPYKQKLVEEQIKQDMNRKQMTAKKESTKEHFDICKIAADLFAGGANFILDVTYNPLASFVSQLKPLRSMKPIHVSTPDWSCNIPIDEIFDAFISFFKAKEAKPNQSEIAYREFCRLSSEFITGPCYIGGILFNSLFDVFGNALNACKNSLSIFAFGLTPAISSFSVFKDVLFTGLQIIGPAIANAIVDLGVAAWESISSLGNAIVATLSSFVAGIFNAISNILNYIGDVISGLVNTITSAFSSTVSFIGNSIGSFFSDLAGGITDWLGF